MSIKELCLQFNMLAKYSLYVRFAVGLQLWVDKGKITYFCISGCYTLAVKVSLPMKHLLPLSAHEVAKYFLALVDEDAGDSISNLKLQKLLYYSQGFHLAMYHKPLFHEKIKAWDHGPVVPQVYHQYKEYGAGAIPKTDIDGRRYTDKVRELLNEVYSVYGQFSAGKLRSMTHGEPPWRDTPSGEEISQDAMEEYFQTLIID